MKSIGDAQGLSGKIPITPSGGFSIETLTEVTPSWKTELNRSISAMEDGIPGWVQHYHKMCCEKGGLVFLTLRGCNSQMGGLAYDNTMR